MNSRELRQAGEPEPRPHAACHKLLLAEHYRIAQGDAGLGVHDMVATLGDQREVVTELAGQAGRPYTGGKHQVTCRDLVLVGLHCYGAVGTRHDGPHFRFQPAPVPALEVLGQGFHEPTGVHCQCVPLEQYATGEPVRQRRLELPDLTAAKLLPP